ncbi:MAG: hypothetical protein ACRENH_13395 [Gemmatimonadaceae bacterium]
MTVVRSPFRLALGLSLAASACALNGRATVKPARLAQLWEEPVDLERRDLFVGPGGGEHAPEEGARYEYLEDKSSGVNSGYDVKDAHGHRWSVKLGVEARTEVAMSRVVWAVGYHQPWVYYSPSWTMTRDGKDTTFARSRFRQEPHTQDKSGEWSWRRNPFLGTRELAGLWVLMVIFNNWDLKTAQNAIYEVKADSTAEPQKWYMVRDLGASLGKSAWLTFGTKDDPDGFDAQPFIIGVRGNRVRFGFEGGWTEPQMHSSVTPSDVRWICGLLARLSDAQWADAFRAGGYSATEGERFIRRLKAKVAEGLRTGAM